MTPIWSLRAWAADVEAAPLEKSSRSSASTNSSAVWYRSSGSLAIAFSRNRYTDTGSEAANCRGSGTCSVTCFFMSSRSLAPSKGGRPVRRAK